MQVSRQDLCITEGAIEAAPNDGLVVNVPKMRAYVNEATTQVIEARVAYLGANGERCAIGFGRDRDEEAVWIQTAHRRLVQSGIRDVEDRAAVETSGQREEQSGPAHQRGVRKPRVQKRQGGSKPAGAGVASGRDARVSSRNEW
jgi:hypothetical protein